MIIECAEDLVSGGGRPTGLVGASPLVDSCQSYLRAGYSFCPIRKDIYVGEK